jgi:WD40 repeat protein
MAANDCHRYPAVESKTDRHQSVGGHGWQVTNARFTRDGKFVVTVGGADRTIIQWRLSP